ncbi:MAG TPA: ThuA domain-containing protein [Chitinophagaceae bacterium]|nr:ThuA domain-containing protein [Chitinophagaceae bacterium]
MKKRLLPAILISAALSCAILHAGAQKRLNVIVVGSTDKYHAGSVAKGRQFFAQLAAGNNFNLCFTQDTAMINDDTLAKYQVFVQLHLAPFDMSTKQQAAVQKFIEQGKGWVGIHAAGLTGKQFHPNDVYWQWFEDAMGGVTYSPHPKFQQGTLIIEDHKHPVTKNLPAAIVMTDEWYEFDKSPRPNVRVLARADESTYHQNKPMGDHPLIWVNENYRRFIYIGVGHDSTAYDNPPYALLVKNAIIWAGNKGKQKNASVIKSKEIIARQKGRQATDGEVTTR